MFGFKGKFKVEIIRKGVVLETFEAENGVTNEGKTAALNVLFGQESKPSWYIGLIDGITTPTLSTNDTMVSHAGWSENEDYDESSRGTYYCVDTLTQTISNDTQITYTINDTCTIYGIFCVSDATKGGTSGVLWATAPFDTPRSMIANDELRVTYNVTVA